MKRIVSDLAHVFLLILVPGLAAWLFGRPLIFPSLGPSAFELGRGGKENEPARKVIGGHLVGVIIGFASYEALAHGLALTDLSPAVSAAGMRIAASGILSVVLTTGAMSATGTDHPPACATTLIVSLGLLSHPIDLLLIMASVTGMFWVHRVVRMLRFGKAGG